MTTVAHIAAAIDRIAPPELAEDWDNTGLLVGDPSAPATRVMTCLTVTPATADEAITRGAQMIVAHHPLPFRSFKHITTTSRDGALLWRLARAGVAIASPHTAFDSAAQGINQQLAQRLGLSDIQPLTPSTIDPSVGTGRAATCPEPMKAAELCRQVGTEFSVDAVRLVGPDNAPVSRVGFACGSGGSLLDAAVAAGCDALVTGEATFHTCLAAEAAGVALVLMGHYESERFAVEWLAERLGSEFPESDIWASRLEKSPLRLPG